MLLFKWGWVRRQMRLQSDPHLGPLFACLPLTSKLFEVGFSLPTTELSYDIFSILIPLDLTFRQGMAWLTNLIHSIVFLYLSFMTKEPLGFLDGSSLLPLLASLPNYHNGLLRMLPTFNFILSLIHPFISLIQYIFIKPFACAKHMAAIKLWQN